jgi:methionine synthase II (cobalamin-independent)
MNKLLPNIFGLALLTGGVASFGSYPKSAQLSCQKAQVHTAICRTEIVTVAGWGKSGINEYPEIRQAKVALVNARSSSKQMKLYPIMLISKAGHGLWLEEVSRNSESTSNEIAQKINQFLQSTQTKTTIDVRSDAWSDVYGFHGQVVGK